MQKHLDIDCMFHAVDPDAKLERLGRNQFKIRLISLLLSSRVGIKMQPIHSSLISCCNAPFAVRVCET
jgi:hypothetical protein